MKRTLIRELKADTTATVCGFVDKIRNQKTMQFVVVRDRTGKVQVTISKNDVPEIAQIFETLTADSVVQIDGKVVSAAQVKLGGIEILPTEVKVLSEAKVSPIDDQTGPDLAMDYRWIDLRDEKKREYFRVMTYGEKAIRDWFIKNEFIEIHTPKITAFSTEGGADVFEVNYYDKKAYLTQSPQLFKQMAMAAGFERTFEIGSQYRAEKSYTNRHASESFALDVEMSYINDVSEVMDVEEEMLLYVTKEVETLFGIPAQTAKFPRVTLLEAYDLLKKERGYEVPRALKGDLDPEGERLLCEISKQKYNSDFIFVTDFPSAARAFYTMRSAEDTNMSKGFDLLYKGIEITSGAQREHRPEILKQNMIAKGINPKDMEFYTQFFEYGCPPHGGFAMGIGRFFMRLLDLPALRDVTFLFRGPDRLKP